MSRRDGQSERGQALTEALMVSWLLLVFLGAIWQIFMVNDTIYRTITAGHSVLFQRAFQRNNVSTSYSSDAVYVVLDRSGGIPEAEVPIINMFQKVAGRRGIKITSTVNRGGPKRLRIGSGTAGPSGWWGPFQYIGQAVRMGVQGVTNLPEYVNSYCQRLGFDSCGL